MFKWLNCPLNYNNDQEKLSIDSTISSDDSLQKISYGLGLKKK